MVRITNSFMISSEKFVRSRFGRLLWDNLKKSMPPKTAEIFDRKIKPKGDVSFEHVAALLETVEKELKKHNPDVLFELGRFNSEEDLSVTQKLIMKIISVEWVLKVAAILWRQRVINGGVIVILKRGEGKVEAQVREFPQPMDQWWHYLAGWFTTAIAFSGGKNVKVEWVSGGDAPENPAIFCAHWD